MTSLLLFKLKKLSKLLTHETTRDNRIEKSFQILNNISASVKRDDNEMKPCPTNAATNLTAKKLVRKLFCSRIEIMAIKIKQKDTGYRSREM